MPQLEEGMRKEIARFLPTAMRKTIQSYIRFSQEREKDKDSHGCPKGFKDHHDACKIAVAHMKLLIELAKWADLPTEELTREIDQARLAGLINAAEGELGR